MRELSKGTDLSAKSINLFKTGLLSDNLSDSKLNGSFNGSDYSIDEQNIPLTYSKKCSGIINGKNSEYIVNPGKDNLHKGKIQGNIGKNNVNLIVSSDLFGRKTISGIYNNEQIELNISKDFTSFHIEGKDTNVVIRKTSLLLDKSIEGKFKYDRELIPLIISYIRHFDNVRLKAA